MRNGLIALAVVIVLAVGAWLLFGNNNSSTNNSASTNNSSASNKTPVNNNNNTQNSSTPEQQGKISIQNMMFTPSQISIAKGGEVTWTNNDSTAHTVTSDTGGELSSGDIQPGSTYSHTFNQTGSYQYHCSIHPSMRGTIVVK